jgi:hypothetical protein
MTKHFNEWENNGNIQHYDIDEYDTPRWDTTSTITKTYGSCFTDLKFFGGGKSLSTMYGDFLVPCYEGFAHPVSGEAL